MKRIFSRGLRGLQAWPGGADLPGVIIPSCERNRRSRPGLPYRIDVRLTDFWRRMEKHLGPAYADSWARDQVLSSLGGRTVYEAIEAGEDPKQIWRAVCDVLELPARER